MGLEDSLDLEDLVQGDTPGFLEPVMDAQRLQALLVPRRVGITDHALAASNAQRVLRHLFPEFVFTKRSSTASMTSSFTVQAYFPPNFMPSESWKRDFDAYCQGVCNLFRAGTFNGMDDSYTYDSSNRDFRERYGSVRHANFHSQPMTDPTMLARWHAKQLKQSLPKASPGRKPRF